MGGLCGWRFRLHVLWWYVFFSFEMRACYSELFILPWTKKEKYHPWDSRREERCSIMCIRLDQRRAKVTDTSRGWPCSALIARDQALYHKIEQCSSRHESRGWFLFFFFFFFWSRVDLVLLWHTSGDSKQCWCMSVTQTTALWLVDVVCTCACTSTTLGVWNEGQLSSFNDTWEHENIPQSRMGCRTPPTTRSGLCSPLSVALTVPGSSALTTVATVAVIPHHASPALSVCVRQIAVQWLNEWWTR